MDMNGYYQPESCQKGQIYFVCNENKSAGNIYKEVEFVDYRPHPGELLIKEDGVTKVIYRRLLYARKRGSY